MPINVFCQHRSVRMGKGDMSRRVWICVATGGRLGGRLHCGLCTRAFTVSQLNVSERKSE